MNVLLVPSSTAQWCPRSDTNAMFPSRSFRSSTLVAGGLSCEGSKYWWYLSCECKCELWAVSLRVSVSVSVSVSGWVLCALCCVLFVYMTYSLQIFVHDRQDIAQRSHLNKRCSERVATEAPQPEDTQMCQKSQWHPAPRHFGWHAVQLCKSTHKKQTIRRG